VRLIERLRSHMPEESTINLDRHAEIIADVLMRKIKRLTSDEGGNITDVNEDGDVGEHQGANHRARPRL